MNRQFERYLQISLAVLDISILNLIYFFYQILLKENIVANYFSAYIQFWILTNITWLVLSFFLGTYAEKVILSFEYFTKRTIQVYLVWIIFILFYLFFSDEFRISHTFIISNIICFGFGLLLNRFLYLGIKNYFKRSNYLIKKVIILGYNDTAKKLAKYFEEDSINTQLIGFIEDDKNIHELSHYPVLCDVNETFETAKELGAHEIFSTITPEQNNDIYSLMYLISLCSLQGKFISIILVICQFYL